MRKKLAIVTLDKITLDTIERQIYSLVGDEIEVEGFCLENCSPLKIEHRVAVISHPGIASDIMKKFDFAPDTHIIVAQRSIDKLGIKKLLDIKAGTRVAVLVGHEGATQVTIDSIKRLGINHLELVSEKAFLEGKEDAEVIVTPGKSNQIKVDLPVVDIGIQPLDITTLIEIVMNLNMYDKYKLLITSQYSIPIIELSQGLHKALSKISDMKNQLEALVNASHDGVVMVNNELEILAVNDAVCNMFQIERESVIGKVFSRSLGLPCNWNEVLNNNVINYSDNCLIIGVTPVYNDTEIGRVVTFRDVTEIQRLEQIARRKNSERGHVAHYTFRDIVGNSQKMLEAKTIAKQIANTEGTILIYGESGVGKELYAQAIHKSSKRKSGPFVAINFSSLPENLVESELFGYEDGAFTGAKKGGKPGFFELAHGGTIFLDEIGDTNAYIQTRLLRVLQEKEVMRVGATKVIPIDVRVIAATNKYLPELVKNKEFREDLFYRLNVLPLNIPPLKERGNDVKLIFEHLCQLKGLEYKLTPSAKELLINHCWPGNVRELVNLIEYLSCTRKYGAVIDVNDFPTHLIESVKSCPVPININYNPKVELDNYSSVVNSQSDNDPVNNILLQIYRNQQAGINSGRRSLAGKIPGITEARLRQMLNRLADQGLIKLNRGRKGTEITAKGLEVLGMK